MIGKTEVRRLGKLAEHLTKVGRHGNKFVLVRDEFARDCPTEINLALRHMTGISRTNARAGSDFWHVKFSPLHHLDETALARVLEVYEAEYNIGPDVPRLVVEHRKGKRVAHYHVVYAAIDPSTGRALRHFRSRERDEIVCRRLEIALGEPLTPSLRRDKVAYLMRLRGLAIEAEIVATGPVAVGCLRHDAATLQQAEAKDVELDGFDARVDFVWRKANRDLNAFVKGLPQAGFEIARGRSAMLLVDLESGFAPAVWRTIRRITGQAGESVSISDALVREACPNAPTLEQVRKIYRDGGLDGARKAVLNEFDRFTDEMDRDGQTEHAAKAKAAKAKLAFRLSEEDRLELRRRQTLVRERYRLRDRIRRARVNRAFLVAGLFAQRDVRRLAALLAAGAVLMTGAGLLGALAAAGVAVAALPTYRKAQAVQRRGELERADDNQTMAEELRVVGKDFFRQRAVAFSTQRRREKQDAERKRLEAQMRKRRSSAATRSNVQRGQAVVRPQRGRGRGDPER